MMDVMHLGVILLSVLYSVHVRTCNARKTCSQASVPHKEGVCGKYIPEMLSLVCDGEYREKSDIMKRSPAAGQNILDMDAHAVWDIAKQAQLSETSMSEDNQREDSFYEKRDASMFLQKKGNYYFTGISCECCYHKCDVRELANYCKNPKKAMQNLFYLAMIM